MYLAVSLRTLLGVVFALALGGKLRSRRSYAGFAASVREIRWLPGPARAAAPAAVVVAEAVAVLLLAVPATVPLGFALAFGTLAAFTGAVGWSLRRGETVRCQCFGADAGAMGTSQIARNCVLMAAAALGLAASALDAAPASPARALLPAAAGVLAAVLVARWDDLSFVFSSPTAGR